jgi:hypothetical protein
MFYVDLLLALDQENLRRFVAVAKAYSFKPVVPVEVEDLADARRVVVDVEGRRILIAAIADIIAMKSGTGRAKDQDDIAMLRRLGEISGTCGRG